MDRTSGFRSLKGRTIGPYKIRRRLGAGGMGTVYLARHSRLKRRVALKVVETGPGVSEQHIERFRREGRIAARLDHAGIARVYEVGEAPGVAYLAMEYVAGDSLDRLIDPEGLAPEVAASLAQGIALALDYAHRHQVLHRDVKPSNVIVDPLGRPRLTDFGLARSVEIGAEDERLTRTGSLLGTPTYMSPEQARGDHAQVGRTSDVYQLGAVLYHLLTGREPYEGSGGVQVIYKVLAGPPPPLREIRPEIPPDLDRICRKAMRPDPGDRYPSALEMARDLERFFRGHEVRAPSGYLLSRWFTAIRAHPFRVAVVALYAILIAAVALRGLTFSMRTPGEILRSEERVDDSVAALARGDLAEALERAQRAQDLDRTSIAAREAEERAVEAIERRMRLLDVRGRAWWDEGRWAAALGAFETRRVLAEWLGPSRSAEAIEEVEAIDPVWSFPPVAGSVRFVHPAEGGRRVYALVGDEKLWAFEAEETLPRAVIEESSAPILAGASLPDESKQLVLAGLDRIVRFLYAGDEDLGPWWYIEDDRVEKIAAAAGGTLAMATRKGVVVLSDRGKVIGRPTVPGGDRIGALVWHPQAQWLFVADRAGRLIVFDEELRLAHHDVVHRDRIEALAVGPEGRWLATGSWDGKVQIRAAPRWETVEAEIDVGFRVEALAFDPDSRFLCVAGWSERVVLVEMGSWVKRLTLAGSPSGTLTIGFGSGSSHLAGGGLDGTIRVWSVPER